MAVGQHTGGLIGAAAVPGRREHCQQPGPSAAAEESERYRTDGQRDTEHTVREIQNTQSERYRTHGQRDTEHTVR